MSGAHAGGPGGVVPPSQHRPPLTIHRRLAHGAVLRHGRSAAYRAIEIGAGEPHVVRDDFAPWRVAGPGSESARDPGRALACLVHITDLQLADVQSPTRFEFLNANFADPRYAEIIPVQRPQEALTAHAVDATLRTLGSVHGPATGLPGAAGGHHRRRDDRWQEAGQPAR